MTEHGQDLLPMEAAGVYWFSPAALHVTGLKGCNKQWAWS